MLPEPSPRVHDLAGYSDADHPDQRDAGSASVARNAWQYFLETHALELDLLSAAEARVGIGAGVAELLAAEATMGHP
jgi:hypothetical protein